MSLSERFSKLKSQKAVVANSRVGRQTNQINLGRDKRSQQTQGKRGVAVKGIPNATRSNNSAKGGRPIKSGQRNIKGALKRFLVSILKFSDASRCERKHNCRHGVTIMPLVLHILLYHSGVADIAHIAVPYSCC